MYTLNTVWCKGKEHSIPEAFSRAPVDEPTSADVTIANNVEQFVRSLAVSRVIMAQYINGDTNSSHLVNPSLTTLREIGRADEHYRTLIKWIQHGFPSVHNDTMGELQQLAKLRHNLTLDDNFVCTKLESLSQLLPARTFSLVSMHLTRVWFGPATSPADSLLAGSVE